MISRCHCYIIAVQPHAINHLPRMFTALNLMKNIRLTWSLYANVLRHLTMT
jgi:hypothetical protein